MSALRTGPREGVSVEFPEIKNGKGMDAMRANLFGKSQILVGDKTSHGGVVISGSATNSCNGIPVARKGDKVTCPKCAPHLFEIAEGLDNCRDSDANLPLAVEGHKTTCGAVLIAESAPASGSAEGDQPTEPSNETPPPPLNA